MAGWPTIHFLMNNFIIAILLLTASTSSVNPAPIYDSGTEASLPASLDNNLPAIFEHGNFRGSYAEINVSRPKLSDYGWNDKISSIIVPSGWKVIFYEHSGYCGKTFTVHSGRHASMSQYGWNDKFSSFKIYYRGKLQGYAYSCSKPPKKQRKHYPDFDGPQNSKGGK